MFFQLLSVYCWKEKTAYMMKVVGEESYVVRSGSVIRVVSGSNLSDIPQPVFGFEVINTGRDEYSFRFCDKYLSSKKGDPGIIPADVDSWTLKPVVGGYNLINKGTMQCLTKVGKDKRPYMGNFMNRKNCTSALPNVFEFYEMGDIDFFCKQKPEDICVKLGLGDVATPKKPKSKKEMLRDLLKSIGLNKKK